MGSNGGGAVDGGGMVDGSELRWQSGNLRLSIFQNISRC